mmetsp:Transcript_28231/g.87500  ORF Transcript_28231/g.87500 Transcript_28231/m.87500 type:complete len:240 (+) Transcript_28231:66-785(+)
MCAAAAVLSLRTRHGNVEPEPFDADATVGESPRLLPWRRVRPHARRRCSGQVGGARTSGPRGAVALRGDRNQLSLRGCEVGRGGFEGTAPMQEHRVGLLSQLHRAHGSGFVAACRMRNGLQHTVLPLHVFAHRVAREYALAAVHRLHAVPRLQCADVGGFGGPDECHRDRERRVLRVHRAAQPRLVRPDNLRPYRPDVRVRLFFANLRQPLGAEGVRRGRHGVSPWMRSAHQCRHVGDG